MRATTISQAHSVEPLLTLNRTRTVRPSSFAIALLLFGAIGGAVYMASRAERSNPASADAAHGATAPLPAPAETAPTPAPAETAPTPPPTETSAGAAGPVSADDRSVEPLIAESSAASKRGDHQAALAAAAAALALDPDNAGALLAQGRALYYLDRFEEAAPALLRSIDVDPADAEARNLLGLVYLEQGLNREALDQLQEASMLAPDDEAIWRNLEQARERVANEPPPYGAPNR